MRESGHGTKRHTLARASQLRGDLEAEGPRLARRDVVVAVGRGLALVEDILDIELRLPGRVDLRIDAGVDIGHALPVVQQQPLSAPCTPSFLRGRTSAHKHCFFRTSLQSANMRL